MASLSNLRNRVNVIDLMNPTNSTGSNLSSPRATPTPTNANFKSLMAGNDSEVQNGSKVNKNVRWR